MLALTDTVELLLAMGSDPNVKDEGEHTPIYYVANECLGANAPFIARVLMQAGADLNARDGSVQCTALHMAARRDNVAAARELLDLGAEIDPRDSRGDTPLRRAVNCNQIEVARLFLERGADARTRGSKGITPFEAARSAAMKALVLPYK